jgi:hypothetical protein
MAAIPAEEIDSAAKASALWPAYAEEIDPDSAREKLTAKLAASAADAPAPVPGAAKRAGGAKKAGGRKKAKAKAKASADDGNAVTDFLKSREGRATVNNVVRGAMGVLKGFMK